ncbi:MAG: peptidoglycan-binding protein [Bryobacteraceae bacterium]
MRYGALALICAVGLGWAVAGVAIAQPGQAKKSAAKKKKTSAKNSPAKKTAAKKTSAKKTASKKNAKGSWRTAGQRTPAPERYKEIQTALASRGYFTGQPDGLWSGPSVDALKRFQEDQNLEPTGKVTSLSLIALGLGPKREAPAPPQP